VLSSNADIPIPAGICFAAEVGLGGEIRPVNRIEQRIAEAEKLGFKEVYISKYHKGLKADSYKIRLQKVGKMEEVFSGLFG
jgi:DNA repair protein RadA/Sms